MITSLLLSIAAQPSVSALPEPECSYDLAAMLELDQKAFDQDLAGGWRPLSYSGCHKEAAELIRQWRHEKRAHASILYWHEGQMRAFAGETKPALALFPLTYKSAADDADFGWNYYVDGTIAFLRRDRDALQLAIKSLKTIPAPTDPSWFKEDGSPIFSNWPPNLKVLEAFQRCWDENYRTAYSDEKCHTAPDD